MNTNENIWRRALLPASATIQDAIRNLDQVAIKIVLVVSKSDELEGTISDGDIRRGLLRGLNMDSPITTVIHRNAFVVPPEMGRETVMQLMVANKIQQIPVVDER
ncbi:CBS domain-containing protein, partial [Candidatus Kaiserbacteria bacterium]|nr:CBS domain-containing protein [Candidatus Kaiserbacteria bacterium]